MNWTPTLLVLKESALPDKSTDYVAMVDLKSQRHVKLKLAGMPASSRGLYTHGIDAWVDPKDPKSITLFLVSHPPQSAPHQSAVLGADSVVEIFTTTLGSHELNWVKTVRSDLIRTPNSVAAVGPRQFYVTNDHAHKVHWVRVGTMASQGRFS